MTETEYETKRKFVEEQLAVLVNSIDPRILALKYKKTDAFEWVIAHYPSDAVQINVTGDACLYIVIDVLSHLFGSAEYGLRQMTTVKKLQREISNLKELQEQIGHALSDLDDAVFDLQRVLQSTAQNDGKEARK